MKSMLRHAKRTFAQGFTLIEMVVVIVVLGIVSVGISGFIGMSADIYVDAVGREQVLSQTRYALERLSREMREALPNSVRIRDADGIKCVEFVPILASSTYLNIPVSPEAASNTVRLVQHSVTTGVAGTAGKLAVYPLSQTDVYGTDADTAVTGNIFSYAAAPTAGNLAADLTLVNAVRFDADSPTHRYYLVNDAISYCVDTTAGRSTSGQLKRYSANIPFTANQTVPSQVVFASSAWVLMAEGFKANSTPFNYETATLVNNAVIQFNFEIIRDDEATNFYHEVHLVNVP